MPEQTDFTKNGFFADIIYDGRRWTLHIRHHLTLSEEEIRRYEVSEGQFLVHMYCPTQSITFKVFLDEEQPLVWTTDASSPLVDNDELIENIGRIIDLKHA